VIVMLAALVLAVAAVTAPSADVAAVRGPVTAPVLAAAATEADVRAAIVRAVRERVGDGDAIVSVDGLRVRGLASTAGVRAVPDAGSRLGGPVRFILHGVGGARAPRLGSADAVVHVRVRHAQATRAIGAGSVLAPADLVDVDADPGRVSFRPFPDAGALVGAKVRRAIAAGAAVAADAVTAPPLVKRGEEIATTVRIGPIDARGRATALDDGQLGELVRVQVDRRKLRGRVSGLGEVEITP
jgi:flagella basal body P-ring formation protein FlgA